MELADLNGGREQTMKVICAWCGRELGHLEVGQDAQLTHGVCRTCRARFFPAGKIKETGPQSTQEDIGATPGMAPAYSAQE
jgi:hypothetical protein